MKKFFKKLEKFFLILLMLFNVSISYYVPRTNSKYITEGSISHNIGMYNTVNDFNVSFRNVDIQADNFYVKYNITFSRNKMLYDGDADSYTIYARVGNQVNTCTLAPEYNTPATDTGTAIRNLTSASDVTSFSFVATCDVTGIDGIATIYFKATETIDNYTFVLGTATQTFNAANLYNKIYTDFSNITDSNLREAMLNYLGSSINSLEDLYDGKELDGLTYSVGTYNYTIDDYFEGYAITYRRSSNVTNGMYYFAFSTMNNEDPNPNNVDVIFRYYLHKYCGYSDAYIAYVEDFILEKTGAATLKDALELIYNNNLTTVNGIFNSISPTVSQIPELTFNEDLVLNIVNIKYKLDNKFKIATTTSVNSARSFYSRFVGYFDYSEFASNTFIKNEFINLGATESNLFVLDVTDSNSNPVKLLINVYRGSEVVNGVTRNFVYLSVTPLVTGTTIVIHNNTTLKYYDLNTDPTGATVVTAEDYDTTSTLSILNAIGSYVYGSGYTDKTLEGFNIAEIDDTITYTLSN